MDTDLVKFNVPCAPFVILVHPELKDERYGEMLYQIVTYMKAYTSVMAVEDDAECMFAEYYGNSFFLHNNLGECLMYSELEGTFQEEAKILSLTVDKKLLVIYDHDVVMQNYREGKYD